MKAFLTLLFLTVSLPIFSQNLLSGKITDAKTGEGLPGATIYITNTSYGTTSDLHGNFQLKTGKYTKFTVFISYIGYQTIHKPIDLSKSIEINLNLFQKTTQLDEITVSVSKDKVWKRNYKKFKKALLGTSPNAKNCNIENPWVLEFFKEGTALIATASEVLHIKNNALGYKVYYLLEYFKLDVSSLSSGGKSSFIELDTSSALVKQRWKMNRDKAYYGSKQHFFKALMTNNLEKEGFEIFETRQISDQFLTTKRLNRKLILNASEDGSSYIKFRNFLKVVYHGATLPNAYLNDPMFTLQDSKSENLSIQKGKFIRDNLNRGIGSSNEKLSQSSLLYLRTSQINLDEGGLLANGVHLNEYGYWAWLRVGDMIPANYVPQELDLPNSTK